MRDSQRQRIYDAEQAAFRRTMFCEAGDAMSVEAMQAVVEKVCKSKLLQRRYPNAKRPPTVERGRARGRGKYRPGTNAIVIPPTCSTKPYLLHELAHALAPDHVQHGWQFAECLLYLVRVWIGLHAEEALKREYRARRVQFKAPRVHRISEADRAKRAERMRAINEQRALNRQAREEQDALEPERALAERLGFPSVAEVAGRTSGAQMRAAAHR